MTVEIPLELQQFVHSVIGRPGYKNEADVVSTALGLLRERESRLEQLRRDIQPALGRLDRGEGIELDDDGLDAFFDDIKAPAKMACRFMDEILRDPAQWQRRVRECMTARTAAV